MKTAHLQYVRTVSKLMYLLVKTVLSLKDYPLRRA